MPHRLEQSQIEAYRQEGYLVDDRPLLPAGEFEALRAHFEGRLALWLQESGRSPEQMDVPHFSDPALFRWLFAREVLDAVEDLIGPDIALWSSHFICKPAGSGKRVPWHEDSAYWGRTIEPMEVVTVWLAIDVSLPENGCMRVLPGTHRDGYSDYVPVGEPERNVFPLEIQAGRCDPSRAVDIVLQPNHCSYHHAKLIHGSDYNRSALRRCGYTMRYFSTRCRFRPERRGPRGGLHQIYLARGRDHGGNVYGDPERPNQDWVAATAAERRAVKSLAH